MTRYLKQIWAWIKKWWWILAALVVGLVVWLLTMGGRSRDEGLLTDTLSKTKDLIDEERDRASQDALIEATKRDTKVQEKRKQLKDIEKDPDTERRRKRLSDFLSDNL